MLIVQTDYMKPIYKDLIMMLAFKNVHKQLENKVDQLSMM